MNEWRRQAATPLRDVRYFSERVRTAQIVADPKSSDTVVFGSTVTFSRNDGRVQKYRIVGQDEADPKAGSISFASPVAKTLMGKAAQRIGSERPEFVKLGDCIEVREERGEVFFSAPIKDVRRA